MIYVMKCKNCGIDNPSDAKFCRGCGKTLKHDASVLKKTMYVINTFFIATFLYSLISYGLPKSKVSSWDSSYDSKTYFVSYTPSFDLFTISHSTGFCSGSSDGKSYKEASERALDNYHYNVIFWAGVFGLLSIVSCSLTIKIS